MPRRSFFIRESELSDDQRQVINRRSDNSFIVKGCAGSGKSILALWKAKQIQDEDKGTFLFVVFTKALKQYMSDEQEDEKIQFKTRIYKKNKTK